MIGVGLRSDIYTLSDWNTHADDANAPLLQAIVLEQHLQWRMTPWYTKAKMYLRGDQTLNWHDTSSHRWQTVASTVAWVSLAILSATTSLVVGYFLYLRYWIL